MERWVYVLFVTIALILMVYMAEWKVRKNKKYYTQYRNGRIERWKI